MSEKYQPTFVVSQLCLTKLYYPGITRVYQTFLERMKSIKVNVLIVNRIH